MTLSAYPEGLFLRRFAYSAIAPLTPFLKIFSYKNSKKAIVKPDF
jgi:hypothetical protein